MRRVHRRKTTAIAIGVAVVVAACGAAAVDARPSDPLGFELSDTVGTDLAAVAADAFSRFAGAAPALDGCIGRPTLEAARELDDLAVYEAATSTITVRVPATAPSLLDSLIHELAHHVEAQCPSHIEIRTRFATAQGFAADAEWFSHQWEHSPSEHYAETVVAIVLDRRRRNVLAVQPTEEATHIVERWMTTGG